MRVMMLFAALPMIFGAAQAHETYVVVEARRSVSFAGKLGQRVEDHLTVSKDGSTYEVTIGRRHTQIHGHLATYRAGDELLIEGTHTGNKIFALPDGITVLRT